MTLKQKTRIVTVAGIIVIILTGLAQYWSINRINTAWDQYSITAETREDLLADIKTQFGYGGIIHNFKNFVLRGDMKYVDRIAQNRKTLLEDIAAYKKLPLTQEERHALDTIESVMGQYSSNTALVKNMTLNGATPAQIDKAVSINDSPAFKGFAELSARAQTISITAHNDMNDASLLQLTFLIVSFGLLSSVIVAAVLIQRTQTSAIRTLSATMSHIEQNKDFSQRINSGRTDEVGQLTTTFDNLLTNIESMLALNRAVLDAVPDPIFLSKDGVVISGNTVAAQFAGVHIKDLKGTDAVNVLRRSSHASERSEFVTVLKGSDEVILDEVATDVTDRDGKELGKLVVARDVTMIIRREEEAAANLRIIREVGYEINEAAQELVESTESLHKHMQTISDDAHAQQAIASETASAMGTMNDAVVDMARSADDAAQLAEQARGQALEGAGVVEESIQSISSVSSQATTLKRSMAELGDHTESIGTIIGVINDIADQTNLLALNAAIEAARAGETGRGFAVVADEVRKLAEKTVDATKDVSKTIEAIQQVARRNITGMDEAARSVGEATDLASRSGEALEAIVRLVEGTTSQVHTIATAAEQQSGNSEDVMQSIGRVSDISDRTADGMRESTEAIQGLADLAQRLEALAAKAG